MPWMILTRESHFHKGEGVTVIIPAGQEVEVIAFAGGEAKVRTVDGYLYWIDRKSLAEKPPRTLWARLLSVDLV